MTAPPRLPRAHVSRHHLYGCLDAAIYCPATVLVAPAGAGKTIGVAGWLRAGQTRLDPLWVQASADIGPEMLRAVLAASAAEDTRPGARHRLVVIDDAHLLPLAAVRALDHHLSVDSAGLRILMLSRWDLGLNRLGHELRGALTVLRGGVLALDGEETKALVAAHVPTASPELAELLAEQTQGWCAAVVLAARAVASFQDPVAAARRYVDTDARFVDVIASEVFAALTRQQRHLLLCVANERQVRSSLAAHLTGDHAAGEVLAELAASGLLVHKVGSGRDESEEDPIFRVHPLLREVARRRLVAGGAAATRARGAVARAVTMDVARGELLDAFDRLVAVGAIEHAARLLASDGLSLVLSGQGRRIVQFLRDHAELVLSNPDTWFPVAMGHWYDNDVEDSGRWLTRVAEHGIDGSTDLSPVAVSCARLMRSRLGLEPIRPAAEHAQAVVDAARGSSGDLLTALLLTDLGATQNWLGDLARAEANLVAAVTLARHRGAPTLAASAASQLALTAYMRGHERNALEIATDVTAQLGEDIAFQPPFTFGRASLALSLAGMDDVTRPQFAAPEPHARRSLLAEEREVHFSDLCASFWTRTRNARAALLGGSPPEAEHILNTPLDMPIRDELPQHLNVSWQVERAFLSHISNDRDGLEAALAALQELEAPGELLLVGGLLEDLSTRPRNAAARFEQAAAELSLPQPATRATALACQAQLVDALGDKARALELLRQAVVATQSRRTAAPFLGWTRHGTPMQIMLQRLVDGDGSRWVQELAQAAIGRPDIVVRFAHATQSSRERDVAPRPH